MKKINYNNLTEKDKKAYTFKKNRPRAAKGKNLPELQVLDYIRGSQTTVEPTKG